MDESRGVTVKPALRRKVVDAAVQAFTTSGIKSVTMDDIATLVGISKRTLYELFVDKEELLEACILRSQEELDRFIDELLAKSDNVLEVLLKLFLYSTERFHATNRLFFEDLKKYPKACDLMHQGRRHDSEETIRFFREGVEQGIFRDDVNFAIVNLLVREQMNVLLNTDICSQFSFQEVYESIMFTYLRGISTEQGARELDRFILDYRNRQQVNS